MSAPELLAVKTELERILSSKVFKKAIVLSNFLRYVVTETIGAKVYEIKEYSIAVNALSKPADFNPQIDAVIRIHAGRLRRSLHEYYNGEGKNDPLVISLKKGSYVPEFTVMDNINALSIPPPIDSTPVNASVSRVAVLPFKNLSGLQQNDFVVDGFCEQLSSDLAQFPEIAVIAYFSTSKFKGEKPDIRNVGKELNTSHLITGSIYRDKKHLRISMQLVNAITGSQLWTQTYDRAIQSDYLYEIFDDIIKQVVPKLVGYHGLISRNVAFSTQLDPLLDQDTIDAVFWYYHYQISYTEDVFQIARQRIEKAVQQNPNYALAWAVLAQLYVDGIAYSYTNVCDPLQEADRCVQKALQLDPNCQHAYLSLTWMYIFLRDKSSAAESLERCITINPRSPFFLGAASFLFSLLSEYNKSMEYFRQSNILNPYYPWWVNLGPVFTHFHNGNYNEALQFANRIHISAVFWNPVFKIAALSQLSRIKEASELANKFQIQFPGKAEAACMILKKCPL
jgi:TolB-like protein